MAIQDTSYGIIKSPQAAEVLSSTLRSSPDITGRLIFGWPIGPNIPGQKGSFSCDAVLVSGQGQVTVIDFAQEADPLSSSEYRDRQDQAFNLVLAHLNAEPALMDRRESQVVPQTVTLAPLADRTDPDNPEIPLVNGQDLIRKLLEFQQTPPARNVDPETVYDAIMGQW